MKIHVSLVDYFKAEMACQSIEQLNLQSLSDSFNITVVDNSVSDSNFEKLSKCAQKYSNVSLIRQKSNTGYTKATNSSVDASADYVVLLNPDIQILDAKLIENCVGIIENNEGVGVLGVRQETESGEVELIARRFPSAMAQLARRIPLARRQFDSAAAAYEMFDVNSNKSGVYEVDWVQSSFWVVKGDVWRRLGGLNEKYFLFMAEPDFSLRANEVGYKTVIDCGQCLISDGVRASGNSLFDFFSSPPLRHHVKDAICYYIGNTVSARKDG